MTTLTTVVLEIVSADGTAAWRNAWAGPGYQSFQATPPWTFGDWIDGDVPIKVRHDGPTVGHLDYAEWGLGHGNGALFGIGVIEGIPADLIDGKVMCSAEIRANGVATTIPTTEFRNGTMRTTTRTSGNMHATESSLDGVAFVDQTASCTSTRCRAWSGDYRDVVDRGRWNQRTIPEILERAVKATGPSLRYRRPEAVRIHHDHHIPRHEERYEERRVVSGGPSGRLEYRPGRILSVR